MSKMLIIILLLIIFIFIFKLKKKDFKFEIFKNLIDHNILDEYLLLSKKYTEVDSKFGSKVQKNVKIRRDIFFSSEESKLLDKIILNILPKVEKEFVIKL